MPPAHPNLEEVMREFQREAYRLAEGVVGRKGT